MKNPNRQKTQEFIIKYIDKILPGSNNKALYEDLFSKMDDNQFDDYMKKLKDGFIKLSIISPNYEKPAIDLQRNFAIAKELGHEFFQKIKVPARNGIRAYTTPNPYLVVDLPIRRQAQLLVKKISIPEDNNSVDDFTGQPTGKSKGSKISYPEMQTLVAMGLDKTLTEFLKYRGGDEKGFNALNTVIDKTGYATLNQLQPYSSGVKSTHTLRVFLNAMHLSTTL